MKCLDLTLVLIRGIAHSYLFSLSPKNQTESDLSHLDELSNILHGHFDFKNGRGGRETLYGGGEGAKVKTSG